MIILETVEWKKSNVTYDAKNMKSMKDAYKCICEDISCMHP